MNVIVRGLLNKEEGAVTEEVASNPDSFKRVSGKGVENLLPPYLSKEFLDRYRKIKPNFGFNGVGELVFLRTYSRTKPDGSAETWVDTLERVVNGIISIIPNHGEGSLFNNSTVINFPRHIKAHWRTPRETLEILAEETFDRMFHFKFLPGGRVLWAMGSPITEAGRWTANFNCGFVSTNKEKLSDPTHNRAEPFSWAMDNMMLGVGVGYDTLMWKAGYKILNHSANTSQFEQLHIIEDSREGWTQAVELLLNYYLVPGISFKPVFDFSQIRPKGSPMSVFGGLASGKEPLMKLIERLTNLCNSYYRAELYVDQRWVTDVINMIGECVVAGSRRSAQISLGTGKEFTQLKDYNLHPERVEYGGYSNNSVVKYDDAPLSEDEIRWISEGIFKNGEPGVFFLNNAQKYGRMNTTSTSLHKSAYMDPDACGTNPCGEQTLEHMELCNLVEVFISNHDNYFDFQETLFYALLVGKAVANVPMPQAHPVTRAVCKKNLRIGIGLTGIADFLNQPGTRLNDLAEWCDEGYKSLLDEECNISKMFGFGNSLKLTTIKPSGTLSLLAGVNAGCSFPISEYCRRRINVTNTSPMVMEKLKEMGIPTYECPGTGFTYAVFVIKYNTSPELSQEYQGSIEKQGELVKLLQKWWSDNQVSCTINFDPAKYSVDQIGEFISEAQGSFKSLSMLPTSPTIQYPNMPFEPITKEEYDLAINQTKHLQKEYQRQRLRTASDSHPIPHQDPAPPSECEKCESGRLEQHITQGDNSVNVTLEGNNSRRIPYPTAGMIYFGN